MHHFPRRPHTAPASTAAAPTRYSDRFIPHRTGSDDLRSAYELLRPPTLDENLPALSNTPTPPSSYSLLLKSELLDTPPSLHPLPSALPAASPPADARLPKRPHPRNNPRSPALDSLKRASAPPNSYPPPPNIFRFSAPPRPHSHPTSTVATPISQPPTPPSPFCLADSHSRRALLSARLAPGRAARKIARVPFKVLDAPALKDDFYFNLVDWSSQNVLAVGLGPCVYLWSACTSVVTKLCDLHLGGPVCSVAWNQMGTQLAVGTMPGDVQVYDTATGKLLRSMPGHTARAGALAWSAGVLSSGSRDKTIFNRDLRSREPYIAQLTGHRQEVCGLKWSSDDMQLASGGNDNNLMIWNAAGLGSGGGTVSTGSGVNYNAPTLRFSHHKAAVKAIAWSPHARGLLASGGGTADRKIRFWNTMTNTALAEVDTGSQVCNLAWSKNVNELVSTHGYSQNQIIVWKYPTLSKVVTLMGHSCRVLYLAMSPSGETIVTGAGDETLRFWNVFPSAKNKRGSADSRSLLSPSRMSIR